MTSIEKCGHNGGQGIGSGHVCLCVRGKDHLPAHGCSCGAIWKDPAITESPEVAEARRSVAEADPAILAAAQALAAGRGDTWADMNVMRQFADCWTARDVVSSAYNVTFANEQLARIVNVTGLSLQSVTEVARELKRSPRA